MRGRQLCVFPAGKRFFFDDAGLIVVETCVVSTPHKKTMPDRRVLGPKSDAAQSFFFSVEMATVTGATTGATTVAAPARVTPLVVAAATLREIAFLSTTGSAVNNAKQVLALLTGKGIEAHFVFGDQQVDTTALLPFASLGFLLAQSPRWPCQC